MRFGYLLVGWSVVVGLKRAWTTRQRRKDLGELRYHVPAGQDAAAVLAAVRQHDLPSTIAIDGGFEDVVVVCDPVRDRERVRAVLRDAPMGMAGRVTHGAPIAFVDEQRGA